MDVKEATGVYREESELSSTPVTVYEAKGWMGIRQCVAFTLTELADDKDGMPTAYAPQQSATDTSTVAPHNRRGDEDLRLACKPWASAFQSGASWEWVAVEHAASGANIDGREWLKDRNGEYPVLVRNGTYCGFYKTTTAYTTTDGDPIDAGKVPFSVLNGTLTNKKGLRHLYVELGDYGVVMNFRTGKSVPFIFADVQGDNSYACKEFSHFVNVQIGRRGPLCVVVFPNSKLGKQIDPSDGTVEAFGRRLAAIIQARIGKDSLKNLASKVAPGNSATMIFYRSMLILGHEPSMDDMVETMAEAQILRDEASS